MSQSKQATRASALARRASVLLLLALSSCVFAIDAVALPDGPADGNSAVAGAAVESQARDAGLPWDAAAPDMARVQVGESCGDMTPCAGGLECRTMFGGEPLPGGYCTMRCAQAECPAGSSCLTLGKNERCARHCVSDTCRDGYRCCTRAGSVAVCLPPNLCDSDPDD
jgi:hypothetical protein